MWQAIAVMTIFNKCAVKSSCYVRDCHLELPSDIYSFHQN